MRLSAFLAAFFVMTVLAAPISELEKQQEDDVIIAGGDGDPTMSTPGGGITKYENAEAGEDPAAEEEAATTS